MELTLESLERRRLLSTTIVNVTTPDHTVSEGETVAFEVERTGDLTDALTLDVQITGTATPGQDTMLPNSSVTFAAGESIASYSLVALPDDEVELVEDLTITVRDQVGATTLVQRAEVRISLEDSDDPFEGVAPNIQPDWAGPGPQGVPNTGESDIPPTFAAPPNWVFPNGGPAEGDLGVIQTTGPLVIERPWIGGGFIRVKIPAGSNILIYNIPDGGWGIHGVRPPADGPEVEVEYFD